MSEALFLYQDILIKKIKWIVALILLTGCIWGSYKLSRYTVAGEVKKEEVQVILDAGHGGSDPGKVGLNNLMEKDINLAIVKKVKNNLEKQKTVVMLTREEDKGVGEMSDGNRKTEDMQNRVKMINETKPVLAVSIHQNSYEDPKIKGAQVFYYEHSKDGEAIAQILQENLRKIDPSNHRQIKANGSYYLLRRTKIPTVILECGFLTNPEEAEKLAEEAYQEQIAEVIADGIREALEYMDRENGEGN